MPFKLTVPCVLRAAVLAWALSGAGTLSAAEVRLRLLETTDVHMNLLSYDYYQDRGTDQYGLSRTHTLVQAARAEATNSLLFDNGDLLQGNPMGDFVARVQPLKDGETHPAYQVMNQMGYDAANVGNHEFNYGLDFLRRAINGANFPYVSANVEWADARLGAVGTPVFAPYVLLDRKLKDTQGQLHSIRVGVIGLVPPQIMQWDRGNLDGKVRARDMVEAARQYVPQMRAQGADLVIAIPHSGFDKLPGATMAENAVGPLTEVPGIDAVLFGHAHAEFPSPAFANHPKVDLARGTINGVPAVMPGRWGDHLGVIDLTLDRSDTGWKVVGSQAALRPIFDRTQRRSVAAEHALFAPTLAQAHASTLAYVRDQVAITSAPIYSYFALVADDPSVQIVSNAQIAYVRRALVGTPHEGLPVLSAAAPFKTGGRQGLGNYTDIPAGPLAIKHVADLYVYPNTLKAVVLTGSEVREWIEMSAGQFNRIDPQGPAEQALLNEAFRSYNFDTLDGVTYTLDVTQPARYSPEGQLVAPEARRVQDLRWNGKPLDLNARFVVATNNYRAYGGGNFPGLDASKVVLEAPEENRQVLIEYLRLSDKLSVNRQVNPTADGNWTIRPVPGVRLTFPSASAAQRYLPKHPQIGLVRDNGDGSAVYEVRP